MDIYLINFHYDAKGRVFVVDEATYGWLKDANPGPCPQAVKQALYDQVSPTPEIAFLEHLQAEPPSLDDWWASGIGKACRFTGSESISTGSEYHIRMLVAPSLPGSPESVMTDYQIDQDIVTKIIAWAAEHGHRIAGSVTYFNTDGGAED